MNCRHGPAKRRLYVGMANLSPKRVLPGQKLRRLGLLLDKRLCGAATTAGLSSGSGSIAGAATATVTSAAIASPTTPANTSPDADRILMPLSESIGGSGRGGPEGGTRTCR